MKTSNKILISFLIFLFSGIIALYMGSKYYENPNNNPANFVDKKTKLSPFSVIVAESGAVFYLNSGKENEITHSHLKGTVPDFGSFIVRNDTLFIASAKLKRNKDRFTNNLIHVSCTNVKSIVTKEYSEVHMEKFKADTLSVIMIKSNLDWRFKNIRHLSIQAKDSEIYLEGKKLEKLTVKLDKTRINSSIKERTDALFGSLINASDLRFSMSNAVTLDADDTSNYDFYNHAN
jgi:hypothetical protein